VLHVRKQTVSVECRVPVAAQSRLHRLHYRRVHVNNGAAVRLTIILNLLAHRMLETEATSDRSTVCKESAFDSRVCRVI
jgi:hypothetical protein